MAEDKPWHEGGLWSSIGKGASWVKDKVSGLGADSQSEIEKRRFEEESRGNTRLLAGESAASRDMLRARANGQGLMSPEILRQGLQQQYGQQRSMAAGASPQNAAMAARTGAMGMNRASSAMAGQGALAQLQERQAAEKQLADMIMQQRGQDMSAATGKAEPEKTAVEKYGPALMAAAGYAFSDRTLKTEIKDGDAKSKAVLAGLKSYSYRYKDEKNGKGDQFGPMAQDMEKAGLGHAVIDTPDGKMVHGAKAALSSLALTAALARRVGKLEKKGK